MRQDRLQKKEDNASSHINLMGHYDDATLMDKSGKLIQIIQLTGIDAVTLHDTIINQYKNRRNSLLKQFTSEYAFYHWIVRRKIAEFPEGKFSNPYAKTVNEKYQQQMQASALFQNTLYIAIVTKPPEGRVVKGFSWFKQLSYKLDKAAKKHYLAKRHQALCAMVQKCLQALVDYDAKLLTVRSKNDVAFSQPLEFLSQLLNADSHSIPLQIKDASTNLTHKRLFFNRRNGTLEMRASDGKKKFAAILSIKDYAPLTFAGILDELSRLRMEYTITQSYRFYDRQVAKNKLRDQQRDLQQSHDESISQTEQLYDAFDEAASGEVGFGAHHFTIVCFADSIETLNQNISQIIAAFSQIDIVCVREDIASECAFWAQLPGNFSYIARSADISTKNMAAFASFHHTAIGKIKNNHWGNAVTVFETLSGTPYYFNFHYKDVGNFLVFGAMGSGKTVLVGFLLLQSLKFGGKRIIFDKDRGLHILVAALGGHYEIIKPGISTGFNPCQLTNTPENRQFLQTLFKKMLSTHDVALTETDCHVISKAIDGLYRLEQADRQLCHIASFFGATHHALRRRFDQWHSDGDYAWLFDNAVDNLNLEPSVLGFDLTHLLDENIVKTSALMYLTYRVSQALEGERGILFCDEGWKALSDEYFADVINDWSRTPRKKNNCFGLATQVASDTVNSVASKAIYESAFCKIFFPNPSADKATYCDALGLTDAEYELIKTLPDDQHYFLLNYGRSTNKESVIIRANLSELEDEIAIISGREETLVLFDQLQQEVGSDPARWIPLFHERRQQGKSQ